MGIGIYLLDTNFNYFTRRNQGFLDLRMATIGVLMSGNQYITKIMSHGLFFLATDKLMDIIRGILMRGGREDLFVLVPLEPFSPK